MKVEPRRYDLLPPQEKRRLRHRYVDAQKGLCMFCGDPLAEAPPERITRNPIDWGRFPANFLRHAVHLQHDHKSGLTEGAVHAYCNAVLWQYHGR